MSQLMCSLQENVLAESRMMVPDCRKRLEAALGDLKSLLVQFFFSKTKTLAFLELRTKTY